MTILGATLLTLGALIIVLQWGSIISMIVTARRVAAGSRSRATLGGPALTNKSVSFVPLLGGLLAFLGCALLPVGWKLGLLAFVVDPGCWFIPFGVVAWVKGRTKSTW